MFPRPAERIVTLAPDGLVTSGDALLLVNDKGRIVLVDTQAEAVSGHAAGAVPGRSVEPHLPERPGGDRRGADRTAPGRAGPWPEPAPGPAGGVQPKAGSDHLRHPAAGHGRLRDGAGLRQEPLALVSALRRMLEPQRPG